MIRLALALVLLCAEAAAAEPARVVDGDTIVLAGQRVRLWGIDAPEQDQTCQRQRAWLKFLSLPYGCGQDATAALRAIVQGQSVTCVAQDQDRYGRIVAICATPETPDIGEALVRAGWAIDYARYSRGRYSAAEAEARRERRGIWRGDFIAPETWRRRM